MTLFRCNPSFLSNAKQDDDDDDDDDDDHQKLA